MKVLLVHLVIASACVQRSQSGPTPTTELELRKQFVRFTSNQKGKLGVTGNGPNYNVLAYDEDGVESYLFKKVYKQVLRAELVFEEYFAADLLIDEIIQHSKDDKTEFEKGFRQDGRYADVFRALQVGKNFVQPDTAFYSFLKDPRKLFKVDVTKPLVEYLIDHHKEYRLECKVEIEAKVRSTIPHLLKTRQTYLNVKTIAIRSQDKDEKKRFDIHIVPQEMDIELRGNGIQDYIESVHFISRTSECTHYESDGVLHQPTLLSSIVGCLIGYFLYFY